MAERIVSPGVFTREKDLSFLPAGIAQLGAAIVGPTLTGPALVPTQVTSYSEFEDKFGTQDPSNYTAYTVKSYLERGGAPSATIVRTLGNGGYSFGSAITLKLSGSGFTEQVAAVLLPTVSCSSLSVISNGVENGFDFLQTKTNETTIISVSATGSITFPSTMPTSSTVTKTIRILNSVGQAAVYTLKNNTTSGVAEFGQTATGGAMEDGNFTGSALVTNLKSAIETTQPGAFTLNIVGTTLQITQSATGTGGNDRGVTSVDSALTSAGVSYKSTTGGIDGKTGANSFILSIKGTGVNSAVSLSLDPSDATYITKVLGTSVYGTKYPVYVAQHFPIFASASFAAGTNENASVSFVDYTVSGSVFGEYGFTEAVTPWIVDRNGEQLFKFHTFADGTDANNKFKVSITNIKRSDIGALGDDTAAEYYSSFTVEVRSGNDTDLKSNVIETFSNVNLNPNSPNYIARRIGTRYYEYVNGKVVTKGNYTNASKYVYVEMKDEMGGSYKTLQYPFGFGTLSKPINATIPAPSYKTTLSGSDGLQNSRYYFGFDYTKTDNIQYVNPSVASISDATVFVSDTNTFLLSSCKDTNGATITLEGATPTPIAQRKFTVPFQAAFDGMAPYVKKNVGTDIESTNVFGFNCNLGAAGEKTYKAAIDILSNADEIDINMLVIPGILKRLHSSITSYATTMCENRGDVFYLMDGFDIEDNITTAVNEMAILDSNYVATYYPWVKIVDANRNIPVWVSPSVVMAGAIAFNDRVGAEWFAPAGLNRGGLTEVVEAYTRLTHAERDELYEGRVNPIATFPGTGVVAWGQKTLQAKPSALDRINVRRLLINLKKFIASSSKYLVFEQNTAATRARFLNIVNPYLESVQSRSGLSAFKVVMDDTNNTAEVIDRNQLVGQIYLQPTRTAEFIVLDFVVLPTGASFPA